MGSDTASAGLRATAARSSAAKQAAPQPTLFLLGAAILESGAAGGDERTRRGEGHVGRALRATSASRGHVTRNLRPFHCRGATLGRGLGRL